MLIFCDSFDHYGDSTSASVSKWTASRNGTVSLASGRFGSGWHGFNSRWTSKSLPGTYSTLIVGMAWQLGGGSDNAQFLSLREGSTIHVSVRYNLSTSKLQAYRGNAFSGGTLLGEVAFSPVGGAWYYIETKAIIHDSAGVVRVRVDGVEVLALTSQDTKNGGAGLVDGILLGSPSGNENCPAYIDDLYVCDDSGSTNNDYLGDVRVEALFPSGNGNSSQLDGSDGNTTDNYLLVDESTPNDDTDYVESQDVGDKDTYAMGNLATTTGTVYAVQVLPWAKKTSAGTRSIASVARLSSTEVDSADKPLSTSYQYLPDIRETKPGGGAWTISDVNAAEFGVKVSA